jgi:hypothetical protein
LEQRKLEQNSVIKNSESVSCYPASLKLNKNYLFHQLYHEVDKPGSFGGGGRGNEYMQTKM